MLPGSERPGTAVHLHQPLFQKTQHSKAMSVTFLGEQPPGSPPAPSGRTHRTSAGDWQSWACAPSPVVPCQDVTNCFRGSVWCFCRTRLEPLVQASPLLRLQGLGFRVWGLGFRVYRDASCYTTKRLHVRACYALPNYAAVSFPKP